MGCVVTSPKDLSEPLGPVLSELPLSNSPGLLSLH